MSEVFDVAILGAGVTGLRLANQLLSQPSKPLRVALIGPADVLRQRISFWHDGSEVRDYESAISGRWSAWDIRRQGQTVTQTAMYSEYVSIDALVLKQDLKKQVLTRGGHCFEGMVAQVKQRASNVEIISECGNVLARQVIDTRSPAIPVECLKQQFLGVEVDLVNPHGFKHPLLMDFDITTISADAVNFIYVIPITAQRLFVEATIFSYQSVEKAHFNRAIDDWLEQHVAGPSDLLRSEAEFAVIPMGRVQPLDGSLVSCGVAGGAARASTGYAFKGAERQIKQLASQLKSGRSLQHVEAYSRRARMMDAVFLEVAKAEIQMLPTLFYGMARKLNGDDFADFLSDTGGWRPNIKTILAAPKWPFIKAAARFMAPR